MKNCLFSFDQLSTDHCTRSAVQLCAGSRKLDVCRKDKQTGMKTVGEKHSMRSKGQHVEPITQTNLLLSLAACIPYIAPLHVNNICILLTQPDPIDFVGYPKVN